VLGQFRDAHQHRHDQQAQPEFVLSQFSATWYNRAMNCDNDDSFGETVATISVNQVVYDLGPETAEDTVVLDVSGPPLSDTAEGEDYAVWLHVGNVSIELNEDQARLLASAMVVAANKAHQLHDLRTFVPVQNARDR
jgi:uncharacterized membrane protein